MKRFSVLNPHVTAVIENEWRQLLRSKIVIFTTLVPPVLLVLIALGILLFSALISADVTRITREATMTLPDGSLLAWSGKDALQMILLSPFIVLFQMIPLVVPVTIASYSIIGEKQSHSLEALLSTPIRTWELLVGKALAAALPAILVTWYAFAIFAIAARFVVSDQVFVRLIIGPTWMLTIALLTPLFTLLAVGLGIIISSRVGDPQSAQQLGSLVVLPLIGVLVAQVTGVVNLNAMLVVGTALVIGLLDAALLAVAVRLFRRETILTTWR